MSYSDAVPATLALLATLVLAVPAAAQQGARPAGAADTVMVPAVTIVGVVRDTAGRALRGAEVRTGARSFAVTDDEGRFTLLGVTPDSVQLLVRRIGYQPADVVLVAAPGVRVELAVKLVPAAVELGTIVVEGRAMDTRLWQTGFYDRQKSGFGTHFGPEKLGRYGATLSALMSEIPSARVVSGNFGSGVAYGPSMAGGYCPLNVFIDGVFIRWAPEIGLDQLVDRNEILAVEVYPRVTEMPSVLSRTVGPVDGAVGGAVPSAGGVSLVGVSSVDCGALIVWTKPLGKGG